ncbi:MAG TPA: nuclear transport factor 2 family protein [Chitinophagaceae bacterium]|nr:nuclear transport factor 2 family protein [Chitinophagaceae bacterium]
MRNKFHLAVLFAISALFFSACTAPAGEAKAIDMEKAKADIQAMEDAYAAGEKAKDTSAVAAYYSDDVISYNRNEEPAFGKAAIQARIADRLAKDTTGNYSTYKIVDIFAEGNMLVEISSWTMFNLSGTEVDHGHYMSYFQLRDGKYACVRDMSVSSTPAKPSM